MKIAVAGATGRVGTPIVEILTAAGHDVVPMSRSTGVDVTTGEGLDEALAGVDSVIDAATGPSPDEKEATDFFVAAARNLQGAAARAGVNQIVVISIVGIDKFSSGYNAAKLAQEREHARGPVPVAVLRATQFHEFVEALLSWGIQGDVAYVWPMRTQLVAARAVAEVAADMATRLDAAAETPLVEVAGPREETLAGAAQRLVDRRGMGLKVVSSDTGGDQDMELMASGALLPGPGAILDGPSFDEWLEAEVPTAA